jgi:hypothetical protein
MIAQVILLENYKTHNKSDVRGCRFYAAAVLLRSESSGAKTGVPHMFVTHLSTHSLTVIHSTVGTLISVFSATLHLPVEIPSVYVPRCDFVLLGSH